MQNYYDITNIINDCLKPLSGHLSGVVFLQVVDGSHSLQILLLNSSRPIIITLTVSRPGRPATFADCDATKVQPAR